MAEVLAQQDRTKAGVTAPGGGLYFVGVHYPAQFDIPCDPWGPALLEPILQLEAK